MPLLTFLRSLVARSRARMDRVDPSVLDDLRERFGAGRVLPSPRFTPTPRIA